MNQLKRNISLAQGIGILVTSMLGTGVFVIPQMTVKLAENGALLAWIFIILAMVPVTLVFAKLGARYPHAGGPSFFVEKAFNPLLGRTIGLLFLLVVPVGAPAAIEIVLQFIKGMISISGIQGLAIELGLLLLLFIVNYRGLTLSASIQSTLAITVLMVLLILVFRQSQSDWVAPAIQMDNPWLIASAVGLSFWSFLGIEAMSHLSEEFENPERDYQRTLVLGLLIVGAIYLSCTWLIWAYEGQWQSPLVMVDIFNSYLGAGGQWVIGILGLFSGVATVNIYVASISRLAWSMARDGRLPGWFGSLNRHQVPSRNFACLLSLMAIVLVLVYITHVDLEDLIRWTNGVLVIIYLMTMVASFKLLNTSRPWLPWIGAIVCLVLAVSLGKDMLYATGLFTAVVSVLYFRQRKNCSRELSESLMRPK